jgi:hypothetical protein
MKVEVFAGEDEVLLSTFTINGIDEIAESDLQKKEGVTKPKVSLQFELTRSGLVQLNKAEAKVEETYYVEPARNATRKNSSANETEEEPAAASEEKPAKIAKKRTIPYPLNRVDKVSHGLKSMTKEEIQASKDRIRWYERKEEERARTDKAKNDFESVIYSMREWLSDHGEAHMPYIGSAERLEELLTQLSEGEEWLVDGDGVTATYQEYMDKY